MNQETLTRLDWVIEAVEKAPRFKLDMNHWEARHWLCGTTHCAIGWACQDQRVQETGLRLNGMSPLYRGERGHEAIAEWLDIPLNDAGKLFGTSRYSGKSKAEVLQRLKAYRDLVSYELKKQEHQLVQQQLQTIIEGANAVQSPETGAPDAHIDHD